jgi:hypothetical protein
MRIGPVKTHRSGEMLEGFNGGENDFTLKTVILEIGMNRDHKGKTNMLHHSGRVFHI